MLTHSKKILVTAAAGLAVLATLGSGTLLTMHAANGVSAVSQTAAPAAATASSTKLTAAKTSGTQQNYTVKYRDSAGQTAATFQKKTLGSATTAADQVDYFSRSTAGPGVKLTHGTQAVVQGTMGHTYVHWNTGKWSVTAVTSNADQSGTPTQFANQVNNQLQQQHLPTDATTGAVTVYSQTTGSGAQADTVKWQSGHQLYTVSGQSAAAAVKLAQKSAQ
ncbi:hypothetical protein [Levilactobacillus zymae]|uniref:hypothetical protein n=1 Tax=Levilactobacillus zymae TaxID=267363 RepID=UPI0028BAFB58|nr:hypothetical protein [Levilactobacillus zymae]MDT6979743.1 hypothetical protein [Levilactobacillus zymae]